MYTLYAYEPIDGEWNGNVMYMGRSLPESGRQICITIYHPHYDGRYRVIVTIQRQILQDVPRIYFMYDILVDFDGRVAFVLSCNDLTCGVKVGRKQLVEMGTTVEAFFKELFIKVRENGLTILPNPRML